MGTAQSSHADQQHQDGTGKLMPETRVGGRKAFVEEAPHGLVGSFVSEPSMFFGVEDPSALFPVEDVDTTETVASDSSSDDSDCEEEEEDEEWSERLRILEEAKQFKAVAQFFLHPEKPVETDGFAQASCVFDRACISEPLSDTDTSHAHEEQNRIFADLASMKAQVAAFYHPEAPVNTTDAAACARCFFTRPSAPDQLSKQDADERARIMHELKELKRQATTFLHPELFLESAVSVTRPHVFESDDVMEFEQERSKILEEMRLLKKSTNMFLHPEAPVLVDPIATARCYFARPSAEPFEEEEVDADRDDILADLSALKKAAEMYLHPELPVQVDSNACGRNYFSRASSQPYEEVDEDLEKDYIMADIKALKASAAQFLHPEVGVKPSAVAVSRTHVFNSDDMMFEQERSKILEELRLLKNSARMFHHPEAPVRSDAFASARCYFARPSAEPFEDEEVDVERDDILADVQALKNAAVMYLHPELPVQVDSSAYGRNFFSRYSGQPYEEVDEDLEKDYVLADVKALKAAAAQFLHPESPVKVDPTACARNYYSRPSAETEENNGDSDAPEEVMADILALKTLASHYLHPEAPVVVDPVVSARCYFSRASAEPHEDAEESAVRKQVMEDVAQLKKSALEFLHPEAPVSVDAEATARNFFSRASADLYDEEDDALARVQAMEDMQKLKSQVFMYRHPEAPVKVESTAFARNFFGRASAEQSDDLEDAQERVLILADAKSLKKLAVDYLHPEGAITQVAGGRSYFDRASAFGHDQMIHTFPPHEDDYYHDDHLHEHLDHFGMDEEIMDAHFNDIRQHFAVPTPVSKANKNRGSGSEEGNLSRSPSSVMLFTEESIYD